MEKPQKHHHAKQAGPKAKKREQAVKKKKGTLEASIKDRKNTKAGALALRHVAVHLAVDAASARPVVFTTTLICDVARGCVGD
jgi:hypothetical protein